MKAIPLSTKAEALAQLLLPALANEATANLTARDFAVLVSIASKERPTAVAMTGKVASYTEARYVQDALSHTSMARLSLGQIQGSFIALMAADFLEPCDVGSANIPLSDVGKKFIETAWVGSSEAVLDAVSQALQTW